MATHCIIAKKQNDGTYKSIYSHYDGIIGHTGIILYEKYGNPDDIDSLLNKGDIRAIKPDLDKTMEHTKNNGPKIHQSIEKLEERMKEAKHLYLYVGEKWLYKEKDKDWENLKRSNWGNP